MWGYGERCVKVRWGEGSGEGRRGERYGGGREDCWGVGEGMGVW